MILHMLYAENYNRGRVRGHFPRVERARLYAIATIDTKALWQAGKEREQPSRDDRPTRPAGYKRNLVQFQK
jgi:hypothetical protein